MTPFEAFDARYHRPPFNGWDAAWLEGYEAALDDRVPTCVYCHTEHAAWATCADGMQRRPPARAA